jgi:hypothetical protein
MGETINQILEVLAFYVVLKQQFHEESHRPLSPELVHYIE